MALFPKGREAIPATQASPPPASYHALSTHGESPHAQPRSHFLCFCDNTLRIHHTVGSGADFQSSGFLKRIYLPVVAPSFWDGNAILNLHAPPSPARGGVATAGPPYLPGRLRAPSAGAGLLFRANGEKRQHRGREGRAARGPEEGSWRRTVSRRHTGSRDGFTGNARTVSCYIGCPRAERRAWEAAEEGLTDSGSRRSWGRPPERRGQPARRAEGGGRRAEGAGRRAQGAGPAVGRGGEACLGAGRPDGFSPPPAPASLGASAEEPCPGLCPSSSPCLGHGFPTALPHLADTLHPAWLSLLAESLP
ncbi:uncharacterized protein [Equus caballus]|uniref:uncharacterized protein n=1 Tax=Equus caballus TaxID=9796 RepID=UPI0038B2B5EA